MKKYFDFDNFPSLAPYSEEKIEWYPLDSPNFSRYGSVPFHDGKFVRLAENERQEIKKVSEAVAFLAEQPAGLNIRFKTNSKRIMLDVVLPTYPNMGHMTALGQSGFDLYVYDESLKQFILHSNTVFLPQEKGFKHQILWFNDNQTREYILYFPLYMKIESLRIGFDEDAIVESASYKNKEKILVYGTSITQGGCVSRPGMAYTNILSRKLDCEIYNYGFSGAGLGEVELASILKRIPDIDLLVVDIQANAGCTDKLENNLEKFLLEYSENKKDLKIILVSQIPFAMDRYDKMRTELKIYYKLFLKRLVNKYKGKLNLTFLDGDKFFSDTDMINIYDYTVDGVHPTDLGQVAIAQGYYKKIKKVLNYG